MPIPVQGAWDEGYVMDQYVVSSEYLGEDAFGSRRFRNEYSEIGKLLHDMKYNGHFDTSMQIAQKCKVFLGGWLSGKAIDAIVAVPPSHFRTRSRCSP